MVTKKRPNDIGSFVTGDKYDDFGVTGQYGSTHFDNEVCYTGGTYDKSTGQYYLNARYYDPEDGRIAFTSLIGIDRTRDMNICISCL